MSDKPYAVDSYKIVVSPEEAVEYMSAKGVQEIAVGGGANTFNAFIDKDLVTDIYFNINPIITGYGAILGNNSELNSKFKYKGQKLKDGFIQLHLAKEGVKRTNSLGKQDLNINLRIVICNSKAENEFKEICENTVPEPHF